MSPIGGPLDLLDALGVRLIHLLDLDFDVEVAEPLFEFAPVDLCRAQEVDHALETVTRRFGHERAIGQFAEDPETVIVDLVFLATE